MSSLSLETLETIMAVITYVFVFLFGICIGSFLNVCIYRLPKGESLITNNSHCMTCGTPIKRYDLIPVFSWLILRGRSDIWALSRNALSFPVGTDSSLFSGHRHSGDVCFRSDIYYHNCGSDPRSELHKRLSRISAHIPRN